MTFSPRLSIYNGVLDTEGVVTTFDAVVRRIRTGDKGLAEKTRLLNVLYETDPDAYNKEKLKLPAVTWCGHFQRRAASALVQQSGFVVLDFDDVDIGSLLSELAPHPNVRFAFVSPSGRGVKAVIPVDPVPTGTAEHEAVFAAISEAFEHIAPVDPSGSDVSRLCFLAFDPQAIDKLDAAPFQWTPPDTVPTPPPLTTLTDAERENLIDSLRAFEAELQASHGETLRWDADNKTQALPKRLCPETQHKHPDAKGVQFYQNGDGSVNGYCHGCKGHWWVVAPRRKTRQKPIRLRKSNVRWITQTLARTRETLAKTFSKGKKLVGLRADTGTGKTEAGINYFLRGMAGWISTPTTELAKEITARLQAAEIHVYRWRGVTSEPNGEFPHEKPCIDGERYHALAESGRDPHRLLCQSCPVFETCMEAGYRSQDEKMKAADVRVSAHKDLLFNPAYRSMVKRLVPKQSQKDLIVVDEFDPFDFIEVRVTPKRLQSLFDQWHGTVLGDFVQRLLQLCVVERNPYGIGAEIDALGPMERHAITQMLGSVKIDGVVLDRDAEQRRNAYQTLDMESIHALPKIERADWNLLIQLELFFDRYRHAEQAPIYWDSESGLTFYLPPMLPPMRARVICMNATLNKDFFMKVFETRQEKRADVGFVDASGTEWHPDAKVYQLRTNRNPRATLLETQTDAETGRKKQDGTLTPTGQRYFDGIVESLMGRSPDKKHAVISYKSVIAKHSEVLQEMGVITGHFGGLVGLDTLFKGIDVLHVFGAPEIPPSATEKRAALMYGDDETPLSFERDSEGTYLDARVQSVYEAGVKDELIQAVGRARLVLKPVTVVLWTSHEIPSITHREETLLFDDADWVACEGDIERLPACIADREASELAADAAILNGDVKATAEAKGVSKRQAERLTKEHRDAQRDEEIERVHTRKNDGNSLREIASETGLSLGKIRRHLKKMTGVSLTTSSRGTYIEDVVSDTPHIDEVKSDGDVFAAQGELSKFPEIIEGREKTEGDVAAAVAAGDVAATLAAKGVSERQARRLTKAAREAKREDEQRLIFGLHEEGMSQREIAKTMGVSRGKIGLLLQAAKNGHGREVSIDCMSVFGRPVEKNKKAAGLKKIC